MTPRLLLLTGPAAGEVAQVFRDDCHCLCPTGDLHRTWDEVRDYWDAPRRIVGELEEHEGVEYEIRSLPGGEAWLVGLVLPEPHGMINHWSTPMPVYGRRDLTDDHIAMLLRVRGLPARLAILAPEPPLLLVERVRAWGGEVWECCGPEMADFGNRKADPDQTECNIDQFAIIDGQDCTKRPLSHSEDTWPEAVRAALGES